MVVEPRVAVIVVAAGSGLRLGVGVPKAFVEVAGRPLLAHALDAVFGMDAETQVIVVVPGDRLEEARGILVSVAGAAACYGVVVAGGATRQASVAAGLSHLVPSVQTVLVHDAARAFTPSDLLDRVARQVSLLGHGVIPGLPLADTIKRMDAAGDIRETVDRSTLSAVQTPQGFPRRHLLDAYAQATADVTDDAALVIAAGYPVSVIPGEPRAFKVTTAWDLRRAEELAAGDRAVAGTGFRVGIGTDTHAFDAARPLWLAGLHWPDQPGLAGHSDGDAIAHAITDALLAAAGLGDIGTVFGTSDPRFEGAHADVFLPEARSAVETAGFAVGNVSVQLIGNRPRFAPRRLEAEAALTGILGAPVGISATTTDGLGFTGRGEGVVAIATSLLRVQSRLGR